MLLWIIKCRAIAGLLRPNLLFLVNSIKMSVRTPYSFTVRPVPPVTNLHIELRTSRQLINSSKNNKKMLKTSCRSEATLVLENMSKYQVIKMLKDC